MSRRSLAGLHRYTTLICQASGWLAIARNGLTMSEEKLEGAESVEADADFVL